MSIWKNKVWVSIFCFRLVQHFHHRLVRLRLRYCEFTQKIPTKFARKDVGCMSFKKEKSQPRVVGDALDAATFYPLCFRLITLFLCTAITGVILKIHHSWPMKTKICKPYVPTVTPVKLLKIGNLHLLGRSAQCACVYPTQCIHIFFTV